MGIKSNVFQINFLKTKEDFMRFIELTLLTGLLASGYMGQGQDIAKKETSVPPATVDCKTILEKFVQAYATLDDKALTALADNPETMCHRGQTLAIVFLMLDNKLFDDFLIENFSNRLKSNVVLLMLDKYYSPAIFKF